MYSPCIKLYVIIYRRRLFNEHHENDPNYMPLPEDRPGGFNWGEGAQAPAAAAPAAGGDADQGAADAPRQQ